MATIEPCYWAMINDELIARRIYKPLPQAIEEVKPYPGIIRLVDARTEQVVWERA